MFIALTALGYFDIDDNKWHMYSSPIDIRLNVNEIVRYITSDETGRPTKLYLKETPKLAHIFVVKESLEQVDALLLSNNGPGAKVLFPKK